MPKTMRVKVKLDVPPGVSSGAKQTALRQARESAVLSLWEQADLTNGEAADELGLTQHEFLDLLAEKGLPVVRGSLDLGVVEEAQRKLAQKAAIVMLAGVLDANMTIGLARGGVFELLQQVYAPLYVPPAVVHEVITRGRGRAGAAELQQALDSGWVLEVSPDAAAVQVLSGSLRSLADREALVLAKTEAVDHLLTNDLRMVQVARGQGVTPASITEVLLILKQQGLVTAVKPIMDQMRDQGYGISDTLYAETLRAAGE